MRKNHDQIKMVLLGAIIALCVAHGARADTLEDGIAAYNRGDFATAVRLLRPLAARENAAAQATLGVMYQEGTGLPRDVKQAMYWYEKAAALGHAGAQNNLGALYDEGKLIPQSNKRAFLWYEKAANQGYAPAQVSLGLMYDQGQGIKKNYDKAVYWYSKAAAQGNPVGQSNLGTMYLAGTGAPVDYVEADKWFILAMNGGYKDAAKNRALVEQKMTREQISESQRRASLWKSKQ